MADLGEMNVKVGADISGLVSGVNQAAGVIDKLKVANVQLSAEIKAQTTEFNRNAKELASLTAAQRVALNTSSDYYKNITSKIASLTETNGRLSVSIADGREALNQSKQAIRDYTSQMVVTERSHNRLTESVEKLFNANEIAARGVQRLERLLSTGLELGVASLAIAIAGPLLESFAKWIGITNEVTDYTKENEKATEEARKKEEEFSTAVDKASGSLVSQASKLSDLKEILLSTSKEIGDLTDATVRQGLAQFFFDQKNVAVQKLLSDELKKQIDLRKKQNPFADVPEFNKDTFSKDPFQQAINADKTAIKSINVLASDLGDLFKKIFDGDKKGNTKKGLESISDVLAQLQRQIDKIKKEEILFNVDKSKEKISEIEGTINKLINKFKLTASDPIIVSLEARIIDINLTNQFKNVMKGKDKISVPVDLQIAALPEVTVNSGAFDEHELRAEILKKLKDLGITKTIPVKIGVDITGADIIAKSEKIGDATPIKKLIETLAAAEKQIQDFQDKVNTSFSKIGADIFADLGKAIGNAFSGNADAAIKGVFTSLFSTVGDELEAVGKLLIKSAIKIKVAKDAFKKLLTKPDIAIAVGIGLVALGAFIKSQSNRSLQGFAEGGLIKGPGGPKSDSILARLSAGEYVLKASTVEKLGLPFLNRLNAGASPIDYEKISYLSGVSFPRFATGGLVQPNYNLPNLSALQIGGGQSIEVHGNFELRNDRLVAAVSRGNAQMGRIT